jgi:hypothetical protein
MPTIGIEFLSARVTFGQKRAESTPHSLLRPGDFIMRKYTVVLLALLLTVRFSSAQNTVFPDHARLAAIASQPDWGGLGKTCLNALRLQTHPFADFSPPPHYTASGPQEAASDSEVPTLRKESIAAYHLGLCYGISKDAKYRSKVEEILDSWAHTTTKIGTDQGKDAFNFYFPFALMGASLSSDDPHWNQTDLRTFVRNMVLPANNMDKANNHGSWGVLLVAAAGGYLKDPAVVDQARKRWLELVHSQVAADGSLPLEICRSNTSDWCGGDTKGMKGMAYTHYDLEPTAIAAEIFRNQGKDVYATPEGSLLGKAYKRAADWTLHPETFPYYAANDGKLIGVDNIDYFYILQQRFPNEDGALAIVKYGRDNDVYALDALYGPRNVQSSQ